MSLGDSKGKICSRITSEGRSVRVGGIIGLYGSNTLEVWSLSFVLRT